MLVKGLKLLICFYMALILAPFKVYADSFTISNIVGVNTVLSEASNVGTVTYGSTTYNTYLCNYDMEIVLDKSYLGYIQLTIEYEYNTRNSSGVVTNTTNQTRRVYVNGSSVHINLNIFSSYSNAPLTLSYSNPKVTTITSNSTNVTPLADLSSIQEIIDILNDIYAIEDDIEGISTNQLLELQNIVANTNLANQYLEDISKLRLYNFPIESYPFVNQFYQSGYEIIDNFDDGYYGYPLFDVPTSTVIQSNWSNGSTDFNQLLILGVSGNINDYNAFLRYFSVTNIKLIKFNLLFRKDRPNGVNQMFTIFSIEYNIDNVSNGNYVTFTSLGNWQIIPIYNEYYPLNKTINVSTEFALKFGLRNRLLDNLDIIANGTTASTSAAQSSDSANSQLQQDSNTLFQQENSFKSDMQSAMQNIPQFNINTFGTKFMSSAQWVRTQYERMTNNTPFQHLITFSLLVGLSMILIGKVRK